MRARFALTASITATVFAPDWRRTSRVTVGTPFEARERALLLGAVLGAADVADADRRAVDGRDHEVVERARRRSRRPMRAQHVLARRRR